MPREACSQNRHKDWNLTVNGDGTYSMEAIHAYLLADIREELRKLNGLLHCSNFTGIPQTLRSIRRRMGPEKPRRKAAGK